jgi:hypothetical protein
MADSPDLLTLPFDQFQRYSTVAQVADSLRGYLSKSHLRVLDVGGFHRTHRGQAMVPLLDFLPSDLAIVTDLAKFIHPTYVRASGAALPFSSEPFEPVVTCDTPEEHFEPGLPSASDLRAMLRERGLATIEFADGYLPKWRNRLTSESDDH